MSVRAVIDTNVLVSSFLSRNPASPTVRIVDAVVDGRLTPVHSRDIIDEYRDVLGRGCLGIDPVRVDALGASPRLGRRSRLRIQTGTSPIRTTRCSTAPRLRPAHTSSPGTRGTFL